MYFFVCSSILDLFWPMETPKPDNLREKKNPKPKLKTNKARNWMERISNNNSVAASDSGIGKVQQP